MEAWEGNAVILQVRSHGESGAVVTVLSEELGRCAGYVHGAKSKTKRAMLQSGNLVHASWQARSSANLGSFTFESEKEYASHMMDDSKRLLAIQSACSLMALCLPEHEKHPNLFHGTCALLENMEGDVWAEMYVMWEFAFLKELGFGIDLTKCAGGGSVDDLRYISPKSGIAVSREMGDSYKDKMLPLPKFLLGEVGEEDNPIHDGLTLTAYFIEHRLLADTSYDQLPDARQRLQECFV